MILTFEGPPASGKTTSISDITKSNKFSTIPEVYKLFLSVTKLSENWYHEKQICRWEMAKFLEKTTIVILDGDIFQQLWFIKAFPIENHGNFNKIVDFYYNSLKKGKINFPNAYVYFKLSENQRAINENIRSISIGRSEIQTRKRIFRYSHLKKFQDSYFHAINDTFQNFVFDFDCNNPDSLNSTLLKIRRTTNLVNKYEVFDFIINWLNKH